MFRGLFKLMICGHWVLMLTSKRRVLSCQLRVPTLSCRQGKLQLTNPSLRRLQPRLKQRQLLAEISGPYHRRLKSGHAPKPIPVAQLWQTGERLPCDSLTTVILTTH